MKYLCVCAGGNVRSVALAYVLKHHTGRGDDAIAVGYTVTSKETMEMLCGWADRIVVMENHMRSQIAMHHQHKLRCLDVGPDIWGVVVAPDLLKKVAEGLEDILSWK